MKHPWLILKNAKRLSWAMFYIVWFWGQTKLSRKWKLTLLLAGPLSQVYIRENTRFISSSRCITHYGQIKWKTFQRSVLFCCHWCAFKNDSVLFLYYRILRWWKHKWQQRRFWVYFNSCMVRKYFVAICCKANGGIRENYGKEKS